MRRLVACSMVTGLIALLFGGCGGGGGGGGGGVSDTTAPTVSITSPANGATVSGTVSITASASDNVGVSKVEFYVNNTLKSTDTISPYSYGWDTTTLTNGTYTLAAKAYDAAGNVGQSSSISVTVSNAVGKTATLKFISQSSNPSDTIGGFDLTVTLPVGASIKTDVSGVPLSTSVYLSGQFAGLTFGQFSVLIYDSSSRTLTIKYPTSNSYGLGEFITIVCDVPITYTPNFADVAYTYVAYAPLTGLQMPAVTATGTFN